MFRTAAFAFAASTSIVTSAVAGPTVGGAAPAFTGVASNGAEVSLEQFAGKTVVLEWTNDGCPFVQKHYNAGNMQLTQKQVTDAGGVWISIISSAPGKQGHVDGPGADELNAARNAHPDYVILDPTGEIGKAYAAKTTPHMFVIDGKGVLRYDGAIDDKPSASPSSLEGATNYVLAAFSAVEAGEEVQQGRTKPYGCSVKYGS